MTDEEIEFQIQERAWNHRVRFGPRNATNADIAAKKLGISVSRVEEAYRRMAKRGLFIEVSRHNDGEIYWEINLED